MGNSPDVRVRLSAEGQQEIINAFKKIQAESEKTSRVSKSALDAVSGAARNLASVLPSLTFAGIIAGVTLLAKRSLEAADNFSKLSQKTGVSVETLSAYAHAADLAGLSTEELATAFSRLAKSATEAARGSKEAAAPFKELGIALKTPQGGLRSLEDLLGDVADRFKGMADGTAKAAIAQELFGRSGAQLIPFLNEGRAGLEKYRLEADALGLTITTKTAKAAEELNDNMTRLQGVLAGAANVMIAEIAPAFVKGSAAIVEFSKNTSTFKDLAFGIGKIMVFLAQVAVAAAEPFEVMGIVIGKTAAALQSFIKLDFAGVKRAQTESHQAIIATIAANSALINAMGSASRASEAGIKGVADTVDRKLTPAVKKSRKELVDWIAVAQGISLQQLDAAIEKTAALQKEFDELAAKGRVGAIPTEVNPEKLDSEWERVQERIRATREEIERTRQAQEGFADLLADSFSGALTGAISFRQALQGILQTLSGMIVKALIFQLIMRVVPSSVGGFLGFGGGLVSGGGAGAAAAGGGGFGFASGGFVRGPGTGTSDSIPAYLSRGEYVVPAAVVADLGAGFFDDLREWRRTVRPIGRVRGYAAGGLVEGPPGARGGRSQMEIGLDEGLVMKRLTMSPEFERTVLRVIAENPRALRRMFGG